jgi:hypothetical protein
LHILFTEKRTIEIDLPYCSRSSVSAALLPASRC